jgi:hypothetical protein
MSKNKILVGPGMSEQDIAKYNVLLKGITLLNTMEMAVKLQLILNLFEFEVDDSQEIEIMLNDILLSFPKDTVLQRAKKLRNFKSLLTSVFEKSLKR